MPVWLSAVGVPTAIGFDPVRSSCGSGIHVDDDVGADPRPEVRGVEHQHTGVELHDDIPGFGRLSV